MLVDLAGVDLFAAVEAPMASANTRHMIAAAILYRRCLTSGAILDLLLVMV